MILEEPILSFMIVYIKQWNTGRLELLWVRFQTTENPDSNANIAIKRVTRIFWFPSAYKSYVYTIL